MGQGDGLDSVDKGCRNSLVLGFALLLGVPGSFGLCWLLTWFLKPGYQELAHTSGAGSNTPFIAGAIFFGCLFFFTYVYGQLHKHDND